jgi:chorismate-pyruvate lyase
MAFTTWAALHQKMLDDLAAGNATVGEYSIAGRILKYRSTDDFTRLLSFVEVKADAESGTGYGRTCAGQGGR